MFVCILCIMTVGAYFIGKGTNSTVGVGVWITMYSLQMFLSFLYDSIQTNIIRVNNNLAEQNPKYLSYFNPN